MSDQNPFYNCIFISVHGVTFITLCGNMLQKQICDRWCEKRAEGCSIVATRNSVAQLKLRKSQREMSEFYVRSESTLWTLVDGFRDLNKHPDNDSLISVALFGAGFSLVLNFNAISCQFLNSRKYVEISLAVMSHSTLKEYFDQFCHHC